MDSSNAVLDYERLLPWIRAWLSLSAMALMAVTYPLWFPAMETSFPQIPFFEVFCSWPLTIDWGASVILLIAWGMFGFGFQARWALLGILTTGVFLVLLNQQRLQPWHYQLMLSAACLEFAKCRNGKYSLAPLRALLISIYIYSALSKFDFEFLHTVGASMVGTVLQVIGMGSQPSPYLVACLPVFELVVGIGLCIPRTRPAAGVAACALHLGLMVLFSPLGLNHSWGVILWNLHFIGLCWLVFVSPGDVVEEVRGTDTADSGTLLARTRVSAVMLMILLVPTLVMPLTERMGIWDHWPSWSLYAPHNSRVRIRVASAYVERLPESLRQIVNVPEDSLHTNVSISQWALEQTYAPVYPQARFQLGVARYLSLCIESKFGIQAEVLSMSSRWDGERDSVVCSQRRELTHAAGRFWLNSRPRFDR